MEGMAPLAPNEERDARAEQLLSSDPRGPVPAPDLPENLRNMPPAGGRERRNRAERIEYALEVDAEELPEAGEIFLRTAELSTLKDKPIYSPFLLEARLRKGEALGKDILNSLGYYDGVCAGEIMKIAEAPGTKVAIKFTAGPRYMVGETNLVVKESGTGPVNPDGKRPGLAEAGVKTGDPAEASKILAAVGKLPELWGNAGYPWASVAGTRYTLDKGRKVLDIEATIDPGEFARMGKLVITGDNPVREGFIENSVNWERGDPWNQDLVEKFKDSLFQTGLFKPLTVEIGKTAQPDGERDVILHVESAPMRTVSGSVNYDSDFGAGINIAWEHRNLTRRGDSFRAELPVWKDLRQLGIQYARPYFFSRRQNFLASVSFLDENADAYRLKSMSVSAGIERKLSRHLTGTLMADVERGNLDEFVKPREKYVIYGFPLTLDWNWADDLLDPTRGSRIKLNVSPYNGYYTGEFTVVKTRLDAYQYLPLKAEGALVAAFRLSVGAITGDRAASLPTTMRFFSGGGGSVRGYRYQSIGPRNDRDKPAGGGFLTETSGELRWRFKETMGVTLFVDGGMLYDEAETDRLGKDLLWGGGLGFRYYTPVGPFRVDVATPLTPRDGDPDLQFYISLGQSY
jgi:translocation and assembly module TamA